MKPAKILFPVLGVGATGVGSYLVVKINEKPAKISGKLNFLKQKMSSDNAEAYVGKLSIDEEYNEAINQDCNLEISDISCGFISSSEKTKIDEFLLKIGGYEKISKLKQELGKPEIKNEFEEIFSKEFYEKLMKVFSDWNEKYFQGWFVFEIEKKSESDPQKFICKLSLSEQEEFSKEKIVLNIKNPIDKEKAEKYKPNIEVDKEDISELKKKLKEYFETEDVKKSFKEAFDESIYNNLMTLLASTSSS